MNFKSLTATALIAGLFSVGAFAQPAATPAATATPAPAATPAAPAADKAAMPAQTGKVAAPAVDKEKIAEELSDITFVVLCLANQIGIDLEDAFEKKIHYKTQRDSERHKQKSKLD